jgi:glutamate carboxypeptidase
MRSTVERLTRRSRSVSASVTATLATVLSALGAHRAPASAQAAPDRLSSAEQRVGARVDEGLDRSIALLEQIVNINSGTLNVAGVRAVHDVLAPAFERLGFQVRWVQLPGSTNRAGHLIAERRGTRGKRLLLIGHLDTVFEPSSPFQRFVREGDNASGPGVADMKGGDVVMLLALEALHAEGALDGATITVVMTGDEESPGQPTDVVRKDLVDAARNSDIALGFEPGPREGGSDAAVVARRSSSSWRLEVKATTGHSMLVFRDDIGAGAIYEASRILDTFYGELRGERYLTFNVGMFVGGTAVSFDPAKAAGTAEGKTNVVPASVIATGDIRTISDEQLQKTRERMRAIVARSLPGAEATITFTDGYPSMPPTAANQALLEQYSAISSALGTGPVVAVDAGSRGAADISFIAGHVEAGIDGLGPFGTGMHAVGETIELPAIATAAKRAAILIHRLTR